MKSLEELKFLNRVKEIFKNYEIAPELHGLNKDEVIVMQKGSEYSIIEDLMGLLLEKQPILNFPNFPSKDEKQ